MAACVRVSTAAVLTAVIMFATACDGGGDGRTSFDLAHQRPALTILGAQAKDELAAIAGGDVNGDGHVDLIIGATRADGPDDARPDAGEVYVVFGPPDGDTVDLSRDKADVTIFGSSASDFLGFAVAAADVNGDTFADIVIGAPLADSPDGQRIDAGETYVVFGGPSMAPTLDLAQDAPDITIVGAGPDDRLGAAIATGNTNGDDFEDVLLGSFLADGPDDSRYQAGEAYLFLGSRTFAGERDLAEGEYDLALLARDEDDQLGHYLAMGDLDGDQLDDLVVSAFRADGPGNERIDDGEVYVFLAASAPRGVLDLAASPADLTVYGAKASDEFGVAVAAADVNGDGPADLIVGAPRAGEPSRPGQVYVFFGDAALTGSRDVAQAQQDLTLQGHDSAGRLGATVVAADLDGTGPAELAVGFERGDGPDGRREDGGQVYVTQASAITIEALDIGEAYRTVIFGRRSGDTLGASLAAADWDGDGASDLLISAPFADGSDDRSDSGAVYVFGGADLLR